MKQFVKAAALAAALTASPAVFAEASVSASSAVSASPAKPQKIRCRTDYEIGSLVKRTRRCGDAAIWRKADEASREQTRQLQEDKGRFYQQ